MSKRTTSHHSTLPFLLLVKKLSSGYHRISKFLEKILPILTLAAFVVGIGLAMVSTGVGEFVTNAMDGFIGLYGYIAPFVIFIILAPALARIIEAKKGRFASYVMLWFSARRFIACVWACIFAVLAFGFPLFAGSSSNIGQAILKTLRSLGWMAIHSSYFYAMYAAVVVVFISTKIKWISRILSKFCHWIELAGEFCTPFVPLFMLSIGAYVYMLPSALQNVGGDEVAVSTLHNLRLFGLELTSRTPIGMVLSYVIISFLIGVACSLWESVLLVITRKVVKEFSIKRYFKKYWVRVYPLLWATSSEAIATPLNLYLVKKYFPHIKDEVRRFVIGIGSYVSINGTMICVLVLAGAVANLLGIQLSLLQMLLCVPVVFLIGFGVPGIPGELILFAGPVVMLLNLPEATVPAFLALYLGLQLGLPDSFRTGSNSSDDAVNANFLNEVYIKRYAGEKLPEGIKEVS